MAAIAEFSPPPFTGATAEPIRIELLLELIEPLSHHDPAQQSDSNTLTFNRAKKILHRDQVAEANAADEQTFLKLLNSTPIPVDIVEVTSALSPHEFHAVHLIRFFIDMHNSRDGEGLFSGVDRYSRLESRIADNAIRSANLRQFWGRLTKTMNVTIHGGDLDADLTRYISIPDYHQELVLQHLADGHRAIVTIARLWHDVAKRQKAGYAEKAGGAVANQEMKNASFTADSLKASRGRLYRDVELPAYQANGLRNRIRRSGWAHLCSKLGIEAAAPGAGQLPAGVEAIFENGGNISGGRAGGGGNPHTLGWKIRQTFPLLDLLGGCADAFDLGESRLKVGTWVVCRENADVLDGIDMPGLRRDVSAFDLLTEVTQTRQASRTGLGQMIYTCEALAAGTQVLASFTLDAFTPDLTKGAFSQALNSFLSADPRLGGQGRSGFGSVRVVGGGAFAHAVFLEGCGDRYDDYLSTNKEALLECLVSGTMGTDAKVLT